MKKFLVMAVLAILVAAAHAETSVLRSLPSDVQKKIEGIRVECRGADLKVTTGDEGLILFTLSGMQGVVIDELNFCNGGECNHGVNCATGYTHDVAIYVRSKNIWRKSFSVAATEPIFLSLEPYTETFRALVLSVHGGDQDLGCPLRDKNAGDAWKHEKCDFVVKWDGAKFIHRPL